MSEMLLKHFDLLARAPDGVARLRELILTLAVQGKLVSQNPNDEPASVLLQRIRDEKDRLIAEGKIKRDKPLPPIVDDDKPFELPQGWAWARGGDLFDVIRGVTYQKADAREASESDHLPLLRANNIRAKINFDDLVYVPEGLISSDQLLKAGDFVVCLASGSKHLVGKAAVFSGEVTCSFGAFCGAIRPRRPLVFLSVFLASPLYRDEVSAASAGIGINNLKGSTLIGLCIPVPPLAEQSRIVARVEELMRLCDALEAKRQLDATQHAQLLQTLLGTLTDSPTPEELAANWQRAAAHFDLLLDRPEAVDALEQTILQLAVRGLLVPQDPTDEPASVLLQRIRAEKDQLIAEGKIKRDKPQAPITDEEKPFELPQGWQAVRLADVVRVLNGRAYNKQELLESGPTPVLRVGNLFTSNHWYYSNLELEPDKYCVKGDLLYAWSASFGPFIWDGPKAIYHYHIWKLEPWAANHFDTGYFHKFLDEKTAEIKAAGHGVSMVHMTKEKMEKIVAPLPPLTEQIRIDARVEELRQLCDDLRQRLTASRTTQGHLAEALAESV
jgi:type I restriction enzyme S subunit